MNIDVAIKTFPIAIKEQIPLWKKARKTAPLLVKLYVYSIVFEPFLFFIVADRLTIGFSLGIARIFMIFFYSLWLMKLFRTKSASPVAALNKHWRLFVLFITYAILVNIFLLLSNESYLDSLRAYDHDATSAFAVFLSGPNVRLIMESAILFFTLFHYFWVGPRIIDNKNSFIFLCSTFLLLCYISIVLGVINFFSALLLGQNLFPRHLVEYFYLAPSYSGVRFQGLAGEPRDAFGQLVLFYAIFKFLCTLNFINLKVSNVRFVTMMTFLCLILTSSASGIFGISLFFFIVTVYILWVKPSAKALLYIITLLLISSAVMFVAFEYVERLSLYREAFADIFAMLNDKDELPPIVMTQLNNFYPPYYWLQNCEKLNFITCFFGGGLGTSFALNSVYFSEGISNAHAYISRLVPELGIVGFSFFLYALLKPSLTQLNMLSRVVIQVNKSQEFMFKISLFGLLASLLAHKSNNFYLGVLIILLGLHFYYPKANNTKFV